MSLLWLRCCIQVLPNTVYSSNKYNEQTSVMLTRRRIPIPVNSCGSTCPLCFHGWEHMNKLIYKAVTMHLMDRIYTWSTKETACLLNHFRSYKLFHFSESQAADVPGRFVRVAFYMFFSSVFLLLVRASVFCQMTTCAAQQGIPIL